MSIRILHVSDRPCGFVADTLRALADDGFEVLSLDIRAFSAQKIYDPEGFATFDRLAWLQTHEPEALARLRWADVLFVESGGFVLSWVSRAALGKPIVARLGPEDCQAPALFMVDWASVSHVLFAGKTSQTAFQALAPRVLEHLPASIAPVYLAPTRLAVNGRVAPSEGRRTLVIAGDASQVPGAATALRLKRHLAGHGVPLDVTAADEARGTSEVAHRRMALLRAEQAVRPGGSVADVPDYVLCASSGLGAAFAVAIQVARGAFPLLKRGVTVAEDWLGPTVPVYGDTDQAAGLILNPPEAARAAERLMACCGQAALMTLTNAIHRSMKGPVRLFDNGNPLDCTD